MNMSPAWQIVNRRYYGEGALTFEVLTRCDDFNTMIAKNNINFDTRIVMNNASKEQTEETNLVQHKSSTWTRKDKLLLVLFVLIEIGNGVEIYLPG